MGPGGLFGLQGDPDAAREDDLLEAVGALDVMDPREALEFRLAQMEEGEEEGKGKEPGPGEEGALSGASSSESSEPEVGPGPGAVGDLGGSSAGGSGAAGSGVRGRRSRRD